MDNFTTVEIDYVNPRNGNKPASLKTTSGDYFTLSDAGVGLATDFLRQGPVEIGFWTTSSGFNVASTIAGMTVPKDPKRNSQGGGHQAQPPQQHRPAQQGAQQRRGNQPADVISGKTYLKAAGVSAIARIASACIESGKDQAFFAEWVGHMKAALVSKDTLSEDAQRVKAQQQRMADDARRRRDEEELQRQNEQQNDVPDDFDDDIPF